jgi:hypothetical protein
MPATEPLVRLASCGNGQFFALCRWCRRPSQPVDARDDLRVLAAAKAGRWRVRFEGGARVVVCPLCAPHRYPEGA